MIGGMIGRLNHASEVFDFLIHQTGVLWIERIPNFREIFQTLITWIGIGDLPRVMNSLRVFQSGIFSHRSDVQAHRGWCGSTMCASPADDV